MEKHSPTLGAIVEDLNPTVYPDRKPLIGRHVRLEIVKESDIPALWTCLGANEQLWTHWPTGPYNPTEFETMIKEFMAEENLITYAIFQRDEIAGIILMQSTNLKSRVMEIGMVYGSSLQRTRGATEAVYLLLCVAFDQLNSRRLQWKTDALNVSSCRAAERYGLVCEGCLRQHEIIKGRNRDQVWYSMLDSEWPVCKRAFEDWLDDANFDEQGQQKRNLRDIRQTSVQKGQ